MVTTIVMFNLWRSERANKFYRLETEQTLLANNSGGSFQSGNMTQLAMNSVRSNLGPT